MTQRHGHRVTLVPPAYVRPYVRRNKTDRADAEALLEAVRSGQMPSVPVKRVEQQALVALHRVREQWMKTRTARINTLRGILREHGLLLPAGPRAAVQAVPAILEDAELLLPLHLRHVLASVRDEVRAIEARIAALERDLRTLADADPVVRRLREIPGIGLLTATALVGTVGHIGAFRRARQFASWLGSPHASTPVGIAGVWVGSSTRGPLPPLPAHPWGARGARLCPAPAIQGAAAQSLASLGGDPPRPARPQQSDDCGRQ